MLKRYLYIFLLILIALKGFPQNLVTNGDFETHTGCGPHPEDAPPWYQPTNGSSDYLNSCFPGLMYSVPKNIYGYQTACSGVGYCLFGISLYWFHVREYISTTLAHPLNARKKYYVKFYVSLADSSEWAIDALGAYFSIGRIDTTGQNGYLVNYTPQVSNRTGNIIQDKINWTLVSGSFIAQGGEDNMTIGCFVRDEDINYIAVGNPTVYAGYYVDDVSVYECNNPDYPAGAGNNRTICTGDSVQLGTTNYEYYKYQWYPKTSLSDTASGTPWVKPLVTTTYYLTQTNFFDTITTSHVTITVKNCDSTAQNIILTIYPNPSQGEFYIEFSNYVPEDAWFTLTNTLGQVLVKSDITREEKKKLVNTGVLAAGVYFVRVYAGESLLKSEKVVKLSK